MGKGVKPQIVEILAPDDSSAAWTGQAGQRGHTGDTESSWSAGNGPDTTNSTAGLPGRRSVWIFGAVAAMVIVVAAVALTAGGPSGGTARPASLPGGGVTTISPATTTRSPGGSVVTSGQVVRPQSAAKIVPTTPAGFRVVAASEFYPFRARETVSKQLWADAPPSGERPSRWFEIDAAAGPAGVSSGIAHVAGKFGVVTVLEAGPTWLTVVGSIDGGSAQLSSAGLGLTDLVAVLDGAAYRDGVLHLDDSTIPALLSLTATTERNVGAQGTAGLSNVAATGITYASNVDNSESIQVVAGNARPSFDATAFEFRLRNRATVDLGDGRIAETFSMDDAAFPEHFVRSRVGGIPVEISGSAPLDTLVDMARSAEIVSDGSWIILQHQAQDTPAPITSDGPVQWTLIGSGATSQGEIWSVDMIDLPGTADRSYAVQAAKDSTSVTEHGPAPSVRVIALPSITIVVARMPRNEPGATVTATVAGAVHSVPVDMDLAGVPDLVGVLTFEGLGVPVVELTDAAGHVVATGPDIAL